MNKSSLIFVYNADSGLMNGMFDYLHKIINPETYSCSLCKLTHYNLGKRKVWKNYITSLPIEMNFFHRDEYELKFQDIIPENYPVIILMEPENSKVIVSSQEIATFDLNQLIQAINKRVFEIT